MSDLSETAFQTEKNNGVNGEEAISAPFVLSAEEFAGLEKGSPRTRFERNIRAIEILQELEREERTASPDEKKALAGYAGWGGLPAVFNPWQARGEFNRADFERLTKLLSSTDFEAARRSTLNAHYTAGAIAHAIHSGVERVFDGVGGERRFLEPAAGIGNFIAAQSPSARSLTRWTAVELDSLTARMAKALHADVNVQNIGFEKTIYPDGFFDAVVTNVPFADIAPHDRRYRDLKPSLHNYFLLRSIDQVRPGGVVFAITSAYTMDAQDNRVRAALQDRAELLAAIRLPDSTFRQNAGTEVVTDLLVFRRRPERLSEIDQERAFAILQGEERWIDLALVDAPDGGEPHRVNEYFRDNPEMILGSLARTGSMYRAGVQNVVWDASTQGPLAEALVEKLAALPRGAAALAPIAGRDRADMTLVPAPGEVKPGGFFITGEGKVAVSLAGVERVQEQLSDRQVEMVRGALRVRDDLRAVFLAQQTGKPERDRDAAREALNETYDAFTASFGGFRRGEVAKTLALDPEYPLLAAIENGDPKTGLKKAEVFFRDTITFASPPERAETIDEAIAISLNEKAEVDLPRIAALLDIEESAVPELAAGKIYRVPGTDGFETAQEYLSGRVRHKLRIAELAAAADPSFTAHVAALRAVQPAEISYVDIEARLGSSWIPESYIGQFAAELAEANVSRIGISRNPVSGELNFKVDSTIKGSLAISRKWGTPRMHAFELIERIATNAPIVVRDSLEDGGSVLNQEETAAAQAKANDIRERFRDWVWENDERRQLLAARYNQMFNDTVPRVYDGSHLTLPGLSPEWALRVRPHQKNAAWRAISEGRAHFGHEVGTGKTLTMAITAMELRRLGLAKKPMIAVKKANLEQVAKEFREFYPTARILVLPNNADAQTRNRVMSQAATGSWDAIIVSHDAFDRLPLTPGNEAKQIGIQIEDFRDAIAATMADDTKETARVVKQLEKSAARLEERIEKLLDDGRRDNTVYFEDLGVDFIEVDEAHRYKNLYVATKARGLKGIPTAESKRAAHMQMVIGVLAHSREKAGLAARGQTTGVAFATGTWPANSIGEVFNLQRYLMPEELKARGIQSFDAWVGTFGDVVTKVEMTVAGDFKLTSRLARFVNMPELARLNSPVFDIVRADQVSNISRPTGRFQVVTAEAGSAQRAFISNLGERAKRLSGGVRPSAGGDNMLKISSEGRKAALDLRLVDSEAADEQGSKVNLLAANVAKIAKENPDKTQMIFLDLGLHAGKPVAAVRTLDEEHDEEGLILDDDGGAGAGDAEARALDAASVSDFTVRSDIKAKLIAAGIPADQILDYTEDLSDKKRADMTARLREGRAQVAIGSTERLGTGVNAQDRLIALHHVDAPWLPAFVEQRDGRGIRHGNRNRDVFVYRYVTEGTFDAFMWQTLDTKSRFIEQFLTGGSARELRDEDTSELSPAQVMAVAAGNPLLLYKVELEEEVKGLDRRAKRTAREKAEAEYEVKKLDRAIGDLRSTLPLQEAITKSAMSAAARPEFTLDKPDGTVIAGRKEAGEAIAADIGRLTEQVLLDMRRVTAEPLGRIGDFVLEATVVPQLGGNTELGLVLRHVQDQEGAHLYQVSFNAQSPTGSITSVERQLGKAQRAVSNRHERIDALEAERGMAVELSTREFGQVAELASKKAVLTRVARLLDLPAAIPEKIDALETEHGAVVDFDEAESRVTKFLDLAAVAQGGERDALRADAAAWQGFANRRDPAAIAREEAKRKPLEFPKPNTPLKPVEGIEPTIEPPSEAIAAIEATPKKERRKREAAQELPRPSANPPVQTTVAPTTGGEETVAEPVADVQMPTITLVRSAGVVGGEASSLPPPGPETEREPIEQAPSAATVEAGSELEAVDRLGGGEPPDTVVRFRRPERPKHQVAIDIEDLDIAAIPTDAGLGQPEADVVVDDAVASTDDISQSVDEMASRLDRLDQQVADDVRRLFGRLKGLEQRLSDMARENGLTLVPSRYRRSGAIGLPVGETVRLPQLDVRGMPYEEKTSLKAEYGLIWNREDKAWDMPADHSKVAEALAKYGPGPVIDQPAAAPSLVEPPLQAEAVRLARGVTKVGPAIAEPGRDKRGMVRFEWTGIPTAENDRRMAIMTMPDNFPAAKLALVERFQELNPKGFAIWDAGGRQPLRQRRVRESQGIGE